MRKILAIGFLLNLVSCGEEPAKTYIQYKDSPTLGVKKLNKDDKVLLYTDVLNQRASDFDGATLQQLTNCLNEKVSKESGFAIFSVMIDRCAAIYKENPSAF